jgi:hypothetical protein
MPNTQFRDNLPEPGMLQRAYARGGGAGGYGRPGLGEGLATAGLSALQATGLLPTYGQVQDIATKRALLEAELASEQGRGGLLGAQTNRINTLTPLEGNALRGEAANQYGQAFEHGTSGLNNLADRRQTNIISDLYAAGKPHPNTGYTADRAMESAKYGADQQLAGARYQTDAYRDIGMNRNQTDLEGVKYGADRDYRGAVDVAGIKARNDLNIARLPEAPGRDGSGLPSGDLYTEFMARQQQGVDALDAEIKAKRDEFDGFGDFQRNIDANEQAILDEMTQRRDRLSRGMSDINEGIGNRIMGGMGPRQLPPAPDVNPEPVSQQRQVQTWLGKDQKQPSLADFTGRETDIADMRGLGYNDEEILRALIIESQGVQ